MPSTPTPSSLRDFTLRVLVVAAVVVLALMLWRILDVLLLAFGAALFAILLQALAEPIRRRTGWPGQAALAVAVGLVLAVLAAAGWLFGHEVGRQLGEIAQRLPRAWESDALGTPTQVPGERDGAS